MSTKTNLKMKFFDSNQLLRKETIKGILIEINYSQKLELGLVTQEKELLWSFCKVVKNYRKSLQLTTHHHKQLQPLANLSQIVVVCIQFQALIRI